MTRLPILFVRYAPGSAGNFFISLLQTSSKVACWNEKVELAKGTNGFVDEFKNWFSQCFQPNLENHLKYEPHHPYALDFFSSKHPRGNDLTVDAFIQNLKIRNDQKFLNSINKNQLVVMRLNKPVIPEFGKNNTVINIIVDPAARKWFYRTRAVKLFGYEGNAWVSKENHPDYLKAKFGTLQFQNQYKFNTSKFSFFRTHVIGEPAIQPFLNKNALVEDPSNQTCRQVLIDLSIIFNEDKFVQHLESLFEHLELGQPDVSLLRWAHQYYTQHDITPLL